MIEKLRPFRGIAIALVVLALTAGAVFAGTGLGSHGGSPTLQSTKASDDPEGSEAPEASDGPDANDTGSTGDHGALVSAAAQMTTPTGFRNHGAFVSCVAHMKTATLATIDWSTVTPAFCAASGHGAGHSK